MFAIIWGNIGLGFIIGLVFSLLYVAFDNGWKKLVSSLLTTGASGAGLFFLYKSIFMDNISQLFTAIGVLCISFLIFFIVFLLILCKIMKDKDDKDVIRIRDILLGQKSYIEKYYEGRKSEIDSKLNIPSLKSKEENLKHREYILIEKEKVFEIEKEDFKKLAGGKLKIKLPVNKNLTVTKEFLDLIPSHIDLLSSFIEGVNFETEIFLAEHKTAAYADLKVFLKLLAIQITEHLFSRNAKDVRVHFRCYNEKKNGYESITSVVGEKDYNRSMTFIPYNQANMILRSFETKRALIKSHNIEYDFVGNNSTIWTEYMTGTFYNITRNDKPCLSFGISVKSSIKYKDLFNFLNYCKFESYLQEVIEKFDEKYSIETLLYTQHIMKTS